MGERAPGKKLKEKNVKLSYEGIGGFYIKAKVNDRGEFGNTTAGGFLCGNG